MKISKALFPLFILLLSISSCGDDSTDVTAPSVQFLAIDPAPASANICGTVENNVLQLMGGETLNLELQFSDDVALSQYKIDIHNNFDCHGHGDAATPSVSLPDVTNTTSDWVVLEITTLSGTTQTVNKSLDVPENVTAGTYHFEVQALDEVGNDTPSANIFDVTVLNPLDVIAPELTVSLPNNSSFTAAKGSTIRFEGEVNDNRTLGSGGNGVFFLTYTDVSSGNSFSTNEVVVFDDTTGSNYTFAFDYTVPNTLTPGDYIFSVHATDGVNNRATSIGFEVAVE